MKIKFRDFLLGGSCLAAGYIAAGMSAAVKEKKYLEIIKTYEEDFRAMVEKCEDARHNIEESIENVEMARKRIKELDDKNIFLKNDISDSNERILELSAANAQEKAKNAALQNEIEALKGKQEKMNFVIDQCDSNGEVLNTFKTFEEASKESGVPEKSIKKCVMCVQKTAGGFVWKVNFLSDEKAENQT